MMNPSMIGSQEWDVIGGLVLTCKVPTCELSKRIPIISDVIWAEQYRRS